ncbi:hypothetical protein Tco_1151097 [Tanacetum coccineum]
MWFSLIQRMRMLKILPNRGGIYKRKTYTKKVKTGLRRKLDADKVSTGEGINNGFTNVNTAFEEINYGDESIIPSPKKGQREGKAMLEEKS